jgi:hypothetical protein
MIDPSTVRGAVPCGFCADPGTVSDWSPDRAVHRAGAPAERARRDLERRTILGPARRQAVGAARLDALRAPSST